MDDPIALARDPEKEKESISVAVSCKEKILAIFRGTLRERLQPIWTRMRAMRPILRKTGKT